MRRSNALYVGVLNGEGVIMQLCSTITSSSCRQSVATVVRTQVLARSLARTLTIFNAHHSTAPASTLTGR